MTIFLFIIISMLAFYIWTLKSRITNMNGVCFNKNNEAAHNLHKERQLFVYSFNVDNQATLEFNKKLLAKQNYNLITDKLSKELHMHVVCNKKDIGIEIQLQNINFLIIRKTPSSLVLLKDVINGKINKLVLKEHLFHIITINDEIQSYLIEKMASVNPKLKLDSSALYILPVVPKDKRFYKGTEMKMCDVRKESHFMTYKDFSLDVLPNLYSQTILEIKHNNEYTNVYALGF